MRFLKEDKMELSFNPEDYNNYLTQHIHGVRKAYELCVDKNIFEFDDATYHNIKGHDNSKYERIEYIPYGDYFYGNKKDAAHKDDKEFKYAWLHHQHNNPHHWQHWLLKEDDGNELEALEMPVEYVQEMICDWLSFSINKGDLSEIHKWYEKEKDHQILHPNTRKLVEEYLEKLKDLA